MTHKKLYLKSTQKIITGEDRKNDNFKYVKKRNHNKIIYL